MTALLWGRSDDAVIDTVATACTQAGLGVMVVDGDDITSVELDGELLTRSGARLDLGAVTGLYVRPEATPTREASRLAFDALSAWAEMTNVTVMNRPSAAATNCSKPYQLGVIATCGFAVPDTLVTSDPDDVRAFCTEHARVIYKSVSGIRSIVAVLDQSAHERLADVTTCPTQFQQYVPGTEHRVHVVCDDLFASRIDSDAIDYRYAGTSGSSLTMTAVDLPEVVAERCMHLTKLLGLSLAGIDLRLDPEGKWWCFEVNTSPGFIWFEQHTGQPIADSIARWLGPHP